MKTAPRGYEGATQIKHYTQYIHLDDSRALVLNLLTGLGWEGPAAVSSRGANLVEDNRGSDTAEPIINNLEQEYLKQEKAVSFQLIPTYGCNFKCSYCYEGSLTSEQSLWSNEDISNVAKACNRLANESGKDLGDCGFTVLGGEVIRSETIDSVKNLISELKSHGAKNFDAITNGYELKQFAEDISNAGITRVQITVDGPQKIHDKRRPIRDQLNRKSSFASILEGIDKCLSLDMQVSIRVNVDQRNIPHLPELAREFDEKGWFDNRNFLAYLSPIESDYSGKMKFVGEDQMAELLVEATSKEPSILRMRWAFHGLDFIYALRSNKKPTIPMRYCGATQGDYTLDARGGVYTCWFGAGQNEFKIGDINKVSSGDPLSKDGEKRLAEWRARGISNIDFCNTCKWALICGGGCAFKAKSKTGDMMNPNCAQFDSILKILAPLVYQTPFAMRHENRGLLEEEVVRITG